jgi:hypothetical protein
MICIYVGIARQAIYAQAKLCAPGDRRGNKNKSKHKVFISIHVLCCQHALVLYSLYLFIQCTFVLPGGGELMIEFEEIYYKLKD